MDEKKPRRLKRVFRSTVKQPQHLPQLSDAGLRGVSGTLTEQQYRFVMALVANGGHVTDAAVEAGYGSNRHTAGHIGSDLLNSAAVKEELEFQRKQAVMSAQDVLAQLSNIARTDMGSFYTVDSGGEITLDLTRAQDLHRLGLIKSIKQTRYGVQVEFFDKMRALELLGKHYALFVDVIRQEDWFDAAVRDVMNLRVSFEDLMEAFQDALIVKRIFRAAKQPLPPGYSDGDEDIVDGEIVTGGD